MNKNNLLKVIPLIILALTGIYQIPVSAYGMLSLGYGDVTAISGYYSNTRPQLRYLTHNATGKTVVVQYDNNADKIVVTVISTSGAISAQTLIDPYSTTQQPCLAVSYYDSDEVIISAHALNRYYYIRYNVVSYAHSEYNAALTGSPHKVTETWKVGADYYTVSLVRSTQLKLKIWKFSSVNAISEVKTEDVKATANTTSVQELFYFDHETDSSKKYIYWSSDYPSVYNCYLVDLDGASYTDLGSAPFSGYSVGDYNLGTPSYQTYTQQLAGGVYTEGTEIYLYLTWTYSTIFGVTGSGVRNNRIVSWMQRYNNSVSTGTLLETYMIYHYVSDSSGSISASPSYAFGYAEIDGSNHLYYVYYQDIYSGKYQSEVVYELDDITDSGGSYSVSVTRGVDNLNFKYYSTEGMVYKDFSTTMSYHQPDNANSYVFTNETPTVYAYSETVSYLPADSPLQTSKTYQFTFTIYLNGVISTARDDTLKIYLDGVERASVALYSLGYTNMNLMVNSEGDHTFILKVFSDTSDLLYTSDEYEYTFIDVGGDGELPDTPTLVSDYAWMFTGFIPIVFVVLGPTLMLGMLGSRVGGAGAMVGIIIGSIVGVIAGVQTSILPSYTIYLMAMGVIAGLVVFMKLGGSGGQ